MHWKLTQTQYITLNKPINNTQIRIRQKGTNFIIYYKNIFIKQQEK